MALAPMINSRISSFLPGRRLAQGASAAILIFGLASCEPAKDMSGAAVATQQNSEVAPEEFREIVKEAYIYGFPMVDSYRIQHSYFVDKTNPEYKGAWNQVHNVARVFTPRDTAIQTPNSDTPYSFLGADLRTEPLVISVPSIPDRYYSLQFIDMYTHNFAYLGSRATGSKAGNYLLAGPRWQGKPPDDVNSVIRSETDFAFVLFRTQLFGPAELEDVKRIQARYAVQSLSRFTGTGPPTEAPPVEFLQPLSAEAQRSAPDFFRILNFLLQFAPTHPGETELMERFAKIGVAAGRPFDPASLSPEQRQAVKDGMTDALGAFARYKTEIVDTGKKSSADGFGTREYLGNDYMARMSSAVLGIYGNSKEEANYPTYFVDFDGRPLNGATDRYTVRFERGKLPPVNSFWSLTMYALPSSLLTDNPIDRYLINSPMLPNLVRDSDGGITLYIQHSSPDQRRKANWLPAPDGPFFMVLRQYWPKPEALDGSWKVPPAVRTINSDRS